MTLATADVTTPAHISTTLDDNTLPNAVGVRTPGEFRVTRRNGKATTFDPSKITVAITKAFLAVEGGTAAASPRIHETVAALTESVVASLKRRAPGGGSFYIEDIQDQVELALMREGHHKVARAYVLYREARARERQEEQAQAQEAAPARSLNVNMLDGTVQPLDVARLRTLCEEACAGLEGTDAVTVLDETIRNLYDGVSEKELSTSLVMSARTLIETEPNYSYVAARLLMDQLRTETLSYLKLSPNHATQAEISTRYSEAFRACILKGVECELIDPTLRSYDLARLGAALDANRDLQFTYLGLQTLYDRYFIHHKGNRIELPQVFFMRVAMGLAINEIDRETRAIEFYQLLSSFDFMSSTPTLFNSGTLRPQLSSCYLTTVPDDLDGIFSAIKDNAMLSKFAGGLGNDWSRVRAMGSHIKGTNGQSQGVVPFLKVANDTAVAVNQGGKRKGAMCAYLETWHLDVEEFLDLRKNTGDDRRRTHDMNTANWIPDLFMQRVMEEKDWTLFSPADCPDLHDLTGQAFAQRYAEYERMADEGRLNVFKRLPAVQMWRKMLGMLFETGHPWITFKDPCNLRYTNQHVGVVHSSNLCTEITLHTNDHEIAVCNLGSINLAQHVDEDGLNMEKLERTVTTAMRMLDNVIDYNFYAVPQARNSNLRHRPVGLGIMGFQDALYKVQLPYSSQDAVEFADTSMEAVSYFSIQASSELAEERGKYSSYEGSLWSKGILPLDSINLLEQGRGGYLEQDRSQTLDWAGLRQRVKKHGMRNSNVMAIAPTATISNICGVAQSIEPTYQNLFVKSNLSGDFTVVNPYLAADLKKLGLWDEVMVNDLKYFDGSVQPIDRVPDSLKALYATAFEIDPRWLIEAGSRRQKWIDQAQSLNLYMAEPSGQKLDNLYKMAWVRGLKTTYYLRAMGKTHIEKTTLTKLDGKLRGVDAGGSDMAAATVSATASAPQIDATGLAMPKACSILDPSCEACQ
ncbi:MAG: ribonucleoside-diphosphate reductase subunit alpha [Halothiobacillaceae bacterium]|nr:ribonucleoside-diphosphate reductase subunit alpha [Halothiobacillaceae bacterium]